MGVLNQGNVNIIQQILGNVIHVFKKKRSPCSSLCDGTTMKLHYQGTFWIFLFGFSAVWFSWYYTNVITCTSKFNAETQVRLDYINICLSYPYLPSAVEDRIYLLFYRWIHWVLLIMALIYYIPRKISKYCDNPKLRRLIEDLYSQSHRYDYSEKELVDKVSKFIAINFKTHNGLYFKYLFCNILCVVIDGCCFYALDLLFNGRFFAYGLSALTRDPYSFTDYISRTFPPFVECEIGPINELVNKRIEVFGCHLQIMELYEKLFFFLWFWMIFVMICSLCYLMFLGFLFLPYFCSYVLKISKPPNAKASVTSTVSTVVQFCKIGDIYLLYRVKQHCSASMYYELLTNLTSSEFTKVIMSHQHDRVGSMRKGKENKGLTGHFSNSDELFIPTKAFPNKSLLVE